MKSVWIVAGKSSGAFCGEYFLREKDARARAVALERAARQAFESLRQRRELDVTYEQYRVIQDVHPYVVEYMPNTYANERSFLDDGASMAPEGRIWVVLEDGEIEGEGFGYSHTEEGARDLVWERNWARWERGLVDGDSKKLSRYSLAAVEPGVVPPAA